MSFDVFLVTFRHGADAPADAAAARTVLSSFDFSHDPEFSSYNISFGDGSHLEMYAGGLHDDEEQFGGGMFALRGMSKDIAAFMFEFARAAGSVMFPAMEPPCVLIPRQDLEAHLPDDLSAEYKRIPISNGEELAAALDGGYESWLEFRNRVVGDSLPPEET